jgi:hypothetical protein
MAVMWMIVLAITAGLMKLVPGGWPVVMWATALDGAPVWIEGGVVGVASALGVAAFVFGARADPVSWGLIIAAPGLLVDAFVLAGFVVHGLPSLTGSGGLDGLERLVFPWPTMLVAAGLCIAALRQAWLAWTGPQAGRAGSAAIGILVAALALFGAVQVVRGAESGPPGASIAS